MRIRFIKPEETHGLRLKVLRPGGIAEDVDFPHDGDEDTFHLGAYIDGHQVAVASFYKQRSEVLNGWKQYRIRGMATHPDHRGQGAGGRLLRFSFEHLGHGRSDVLWCNARAVARGFYERHGFTVIGEPFDIPGIGMHHLMHRRL